MNRLVVFISGVGFALVFLLTGCSKQVEGETREWDRGVMAAKELAAVYPTFSALVNDQLKGAETAIASARLIEGEEARIKGMSSALDQLRGGLVGRLGAIDRESKRLRRSIVDAAPLVQDHAIMTSIQTASRGALSALERVETILKNEFPDEATAEAQLTLAEKEVQAAQLVLDKAVREAQLRIDDGMPPPTKRIVPVGIPTTNTAARGVETR